MYPSVLRFTDHDPMLQATTRARRAVLQLACALLLFAQHMGIAHAVWHAAHNLPSQQQGLDRDRREAPAPAKASRLCALDAAFAQVLGGGPLACHSFSAEKPPAEASAHVPSAFLSLEAPAPRSRGPPSLL
jgi:hypothetical protein